MFIYSWKDIFLQRQRLVFLHKQCTSLENSPISTKFKINRYVITKIYHEKFQTQYKLNI